VGRQPGLDLPIAAAKVSGVVFEELRLSLFLTLTAADGIGAGFLGSGDPGIGSVQRMAINATLIKDFHGRILLPQG
jgi:hypothetical protein